MNEEISELVKCQDKGVEKQNNRGPVQSDRNIDFEVQSGTLQGQETIKGLLLDYESLDQEESKEYQRNTSITDNKDGSKVTKKGCMIKRFHFLYHGKQRQDIQIKSILRLIRRTLYQEFNSQTSYNKTKRGKGKDFFAKKLTQYVDTIFPFLDKSLSSPKPEKELKGKLNFCIGSLFKSNIMKSLFIGRQWHIQIDLFSKSLSHYSNKILDKLLLLEEFRIIVRYFLQHFSEGFLEASTLGEVEINDFRLGFQFLKNLVKYYDGLLQTAQVSPQDIQA